MSRLTSVDFRRAAVPAFLVVFVALVAGLAGYFSVGSGGKPSAAALVPQSPFVRGVVQNVNADRIVLTTENGPLELRLVSNAPIEALRPVGVERLSVGDWINGGAMGHSQTLFALVGLIVIPQAQLETPR